MPTKPGSLADTFSGWFTLSLLANGNAILDKIEQAIDSSHGPIFAKAFNDWAISIVRGIWNRVISFLSPSAPGAFAYIQTDPSWFEGLAQATANALWAHRSKIVWIYTVYVRNIQLSLESIIVQRYNALQTFINDVLHDARSFALDLFNAEHAFAFQVEKNAEAGDRSTLAQAIQWANNLSNLLSKDIVDLFHITQSLVSDAVKTAQAYTDKGVSAVNSKLDKAVIAAGIALAAATAFITDVEIPGAIEAAIAALNAEAAASMALQWEVVATRGNASIAQLALADLDPLWATDVLSEIPAVTLAQADADLVSGVKLAVDFMSKAGVPLYRHLRQFGEDTAELDGLVTTVIFGGLAVAAVTEPEATATAVVDVLADPLNDVLGAVAGLIGLA